MTLRINSHLIVLTLFIIMTCLLPFIPIPFYIIHIVATSFLFAYLCTSWSIISGFAGQVSLGHSSFIGIGAYSFAIIMRHGMNPIFGVLTGVIMAIFTSLILGYACFRFGVRGPYFTFATMAFCEALYLATIALKEITGGSLGITTSLKISFIPISIKIVSYYLVMAVFLLSVFLVRRIYFSKFGYYLMAVREDEDAAAACGINVLKIKMMAICLSAVLSALGGSLYAMYYGYITPDGVLSLSLSFQIATFSLVGGAKIWFGPMIGALLVTPITEVFRFLVGGVYTGVPLLCYGCLILIIARFAPGGISSIILRRGKLK
ncbi:MAG: branched-chain amino acid ABC transporter permease [Nitrososphaeria archaeon]